MTSPAQTHQFRLSEGDGIQHRLDALHPAPPEQLFEVDIYREHVGGSWNEGNSSRRWSITYSPEFVKQVAKGKKLKPLDAILARAELPGVRVGDVDPLLAFLWRLGEKRGWHLVSGIGAHVAFNAKSFRTPSAQFPLRSSHARFNLSDCHCEWRRLEKAGKCQISMRCLALWLQF